MTDTCTHDDILNGKISDEEIVVAVKKLKNYKSTGYKFIVNEHISSTLSIFIRSFLILLSVVSSFQMSG